MKCSDKKKVYRETLYGLLGERKMTADELSRRLGFARNYVTGLFCRDGSSGYYEMSRLQRIAIASILDCADSDLTAIPVSDKARQKLEPETDLGQLMDQMTAGFAMLHADIRNLIEVMEKYWKPAEPQVTIDRGQWDNK